MNETARKNKIVYKYKGLTVFFSRKNKISVDVKLFTFKIINYPYFNQSYKVEDRYVR